VRFQAEHSGTIGAGQSSEGYRPTKDIMTETDVHDVFVVGAHNAYVMENQA